MQGGHPQSETIKKYVQLKNKTFEIFGHTFSKMNINL